MTLIIRLTRGIHMCMINRTTLTSRMNMDKTETTMLKFVMLLACQHSLFAVEGPGGLHSQVRPNQWCFWNRTVICVCIEDLIWARVEAILPAHFPELGAVGIWARDAEERKSSDCSSQLSYHQPNHDPKISPFLCDEHYDERRLKFRGERLRGLGLSRARRSDHVSLVFSNRDVCTFIDEDSSDTE